MNVYVYSKQEVPTIVIDLLCAKAYDEIGVKKTYPETLLDWSRRLANTVSKRQQIWFYEEFWEMF